MDRDTRTALSLLSKTQIPGSYGPLYSLFTCPEEYYTAISTLASTSLFNIVTDTDTTATTLLAHLAKKNSGRVTVMPINRLSPKHTPAVPDSVVAVMDILAFDKTHEKALMHVFGRAVICPDLDTANSVSKSLGVTAVTLDGDRVGKKGFLKIIFR